jgi:hypothetical protein
MTKTCCSAAMFPSLLVIDTSLYPFGPEPESVTETITVTDTKLPFGGQSVLGVA